MQGESSDEPYQRMNCMMLNPSDKYNIQNTLNKSYSSVEALDEVFFVPTDFIQVKTPKELAETYSLKEKIGDGTYSHVYRAVHRQTG